MDMIWRSRMKKGVSSITRELTPVLFRFRFLNEGFDGLKTDIADAVLKTAGIFVSGIFVHADQHQRFRQNRMFFKCLFGNKLSLSGQFNLSVAADGNKTVFSEFFHRNADGGLGKSHFVDNVNGAYRTVSFFRIYIVSK